MTQEKPKKKLPERKCVGCSDRKPKNELVRILRTPDGAIILDKTGKKSGRGAYLCRNAACFRKAVKAKRLQSALECEIPEEILSELEKELGETAKETIKQMPADKHRDNRITSDSITSDSITSDSITSDSITSDSITSDSIASDSAMSDSGKKQEETEKA